MCFCQECQVLARENRCFGGLLLSKITTVISYVSCECARQKVDEQKADIERLEQILDGKVEAEKKNIGK